MPRVLGGAKLSIHDRDAQTFSVAQTSAGVREKMVRGEARISNFRDRRSSNLYDVVGAPVTV